MFLTQVKQFKGTEFWRYLVGSLIIIAFSFLGQIPLMLGWLLKLGKEGLADTPQRDLMHIFDQNTTLFFMLLSFAIALVGLLVVLKHLHKQSFKQIVSIRPKVSWKRILFSFSIMAIFIVFSTYADYSANPQDYEWNFQLQPFLILVVISVLLIPVQTSVEEFVFRGYLMQGFAKLADNRLFALIMTSVIFGGMHIANPEVQEMGLMVMIFYIGTGLFLGIITLMDEGMELALGFHAANNLITALLVTADYSAIQTPSVLKNILTPSVGIDVLAPVLIVYPILIFVFAKKYKWTGWQQKLVGKI